MYLDSFVFGESDKHVYPNWVLAEKELGRVEFARSQFSMEAMVQGNLPS